MNDKYYPYNEDGTERYISFDDVMKGKRCHICGNVSLFDTYVFIDKQRVIVCEKCEMLGREKKVRGR
jgi:hypothetical protein